MPAIQSIRRNAWVIVIGAFWLVAALGGIFRLASYANTPGEPGVTPHNWPASSLLACDPQKPTLLMFIHPRCPCTRASVGELALLMAHCQGRVKAIALFLQPKEFDTNWALSDTWCDCSNIPGVTVALDADGREAGLFHAHTSGETALYNPRGELMFHGGITMARGHSGDNPGRSAMEALLLGQTCSVTNTPVFGCSLFRCAITNRPSSL